MRTVYEQGLPGIASGATYKITAKHSGFAIGVIGTSNLDSGAAIKQGSDPGDDESKWIITKLDGDYYKIVNKNSGKALKGSGSADGAALYQDSCASGDTPDDEWQIVDAGGGYYNFINRNSGKCMEVPDGSRFAPTAVVQNTLNNDDHQMFAVVQVTAGEIELPNFFTSNMVLQRNKSHVIWGKAAASTSLTVELTNGSDASQQNVTSDSVGSWTASLNPLPAGGPYTLTVTAGSTAETVTGVFVGDVFVLAGQSQIVQDYQRFRDHGIDPDKVPSLPTDPLIKHVTLAAIDSSSPRFHVPFRDGSRSWLELDSTNNIGISVLGLFFAERQLIKNPGIPVGLMSMAWGGTSITRWVRSAPENNTALYSADDGSVFNNHIAPLTKYKIAGILWYQGESDWNNGTMYAEVFPIMINDFRSLWGEEDLPFVYAQLARYSGYDFTAVREAQRLALDNVNNPSNIGMVVTIDTDKGTSDNLHPLGKETIGERLSLIVDYIFSGNTSSTVYTGPLFQSAIVSGNSIIVQFKPISIGGGLMVQDVYAQNSGGSLQEFEVAGSNGIFHAATATIAANNTVEVSSSSVTSPVYVRYAYSQVPANPNLFNKEGLPASPFTSQRLG